METTKSWIDVFQGFFSREFVMHFMAFVLGGLLLWRNEGSDMGSILVMGAVGSYGILRTTQKVVDARESTKRVQGNGSSGATPATAVAATPAAVVPTSVPAVAAPMKTNLLLLPLLALGFNSCSLLTTPDVQPVVDGVHAMDVKFAELRGGVQKLLNYLQNNGMPNETYQLYQGFVTERAEDHDRIRTATLAACADLGDVSLGEVFATTEEVSARVKSLIDSLKTSKEMK